MSAGSLLAVAHGAVVQAGGALHEALPAAVPVPALLRVPGAADPSPSPSSIEIPPEDQTSPGLLGFLVTFAVAAAVIALAFSLVRHLRVVERNARRLEEEDAAAGEQAGRGAATGGGATAGGDVASSGDGAPPSRADDVTRPGPTDDGQAASEDRDRP